MRIVVSFLQTLDADVGVNLGGDQVRVAKQLLNTSQVGPMVEEVSGETVTEFVRRKTGIQTGTDEVALEAELQNPGLNGIGSVAGRPENGVFELRHAGERLPVFLDRTQRGRADGCNSFFFAFATNAKQEFGLI